MKPEQQRIKIAEACGWVDIERQDRPLAPDQEVWRFLGRHNLVKDTLHRKHRIPDYLNDLNAMHEAEKSIRMPGLALWCEYSRTIRRICDESLYSEIHATAAQRAEAFLKTLGLWEEKP